MKRTTPPEEMKRMNTCRLDYTTPKDHRTEVNGTERHISSGHRRIGSVQIWTCMHGHARNSQTCDTKRPNTKEHTLRMPREMNRTIHAFLLPKVRMRTWLLPGGQCGMPSFWKRLPPRCAFHPDVPFIGACLPDVSSIQTPSIRTCLSFGLSSRPFIQQLTLSGLSSGPLVGAPFRRIGSFRPYTSTCPPSKVLWAYSQ
ncbi:hypothetical protein Tco_1297496 [Tanacetum coccineum]